LNSSAATAALRGGRTCACRWRFPEIANQTEVHLEEFERTGVRCGPAHHIRQLRYSFNYLAGKRMVIAAPAGDALGGAAS
jgi:hypothetical protein